jgi:tetratricopeptide (TPR) repeat protein
LVKTLTLHDDPFALYVQASALEQQGDFAGALQALVRLQDCNVLIDFAKRAANANVQAEALIAYNAAWEIDPEKGMLTLANYLTSKKGDLIDAETVLNKALAAYPMSSQRFSWYHSLAGCRNPRVIAPGSQLCAGSKRTPGDDDLLPRGDCLSDGIYSG